MTACIPLLQRATRAGEPACGLAFHHVGGPLLAVCGLTGGAGATTVAYLLARQAAIESSTPILLTETTENRAGLATVTGHATPHPLSALATQLTDHTPTDTFAEIKPRLRLVAGRPRETVPPEADLLGTVLAHAREAHGLVVVDCGTSWRADSPVLASATAIAWTLAATQSGLRSAQTMLESAVLPSAGIRREALVVTASQEDQAPVRAFRRIARSRCARLVLIPRVERSALDENVLDERVAHALTGLAPLLRSAQ